MVHVVLLKFIHLTELTIDQINKLPTLRSLFAQIAGAALVINLDSKESGISANLYQKQAVERIPKRCYSSFMY